MNRRILHQCRRRGSLMVELIVCSIMLAVVGATVAPGIKAVVDQRKKARFETLAIVELNNAAFRLQHGTSPQDLEISDWFADRYPEAEILAEDAGSTDDLPELQPIRLTLTQQSSEIAVQSRRSLVIWLSGSEAVR